MPCPPPEKQQVQGDPSTNFRPMKKESTAGFLSSCCSNSSLLVAHQTEWGTSGDRGRCRQSNVRGLGRKTVYCPIVWNPAKGYGLRIGRHGFTGRTSTLEVDPGAAGHAKLGLRGRLPYGCCWGNVCRTLSRVQSGATREVWSSRPGESSGSQSGQCEFDGPSDGAVDVLSPHNDGPRRDLHDPLCAARLTAPRGGW